MIPQTHVQFVYFFMWKKQVRWSRRKAFTSFSHCMALHCFFCGNGCSIFAWELCALWLNLLTNMGHKCLAKCNWNCMNPFHLKYTPLQLAKNLMSHLFIVVKWTTDIFSWADWLWNSLFFFASFFDKALFASWA